MYDNHNQIIYISDNSNNIIYTDYIENSNNIIHTENSNNIIHTNISNLSSLPSLTTLPSLTGLTTLPSLTSLPMLNVPDIPYNPTSPSSNNYNSPTSPENYKLLIEFRDYCNLIMKKFNLMHYIENNEIHQPTIWRKSVNRLRKNFSNILIKDKKYVNDDKNYNITNTYNANKINLKIIQLALTTLQNMEKENNNTKAKMEQLVFENKSLKTKVKALKYQIETLITVDNQCCICLVNRNNHAFMKCGHMCVCGICAPKCALKCPLCKKHSAVIKIFF
jgi:hypothetical protein